MDIVPDMDDLLNELEAAETTQKLKYDANDPVMNPKVVVLDSSNDFIDKQNGIHILHNNHIEEVNSDAEATNVLFDIITSLSSNESRSLQHNMEVNHVIEEATEVLKDSTSENSISADTADCKKDETEVTDEVDRIAERYAEMEHYLDSCDTNETSVNISEQSDREIPSIFPATKAIEGEVINVEETDRKSLSDELNSDRNFQSASELEKETNRDVRNTVVEMVVKDVDVTTECDVASCTGIDEQPIDEVLHVTSVTAEDDSGLDDMQEDVNICINGNTTLVERPSLSPCCAQSSVTIGNIEETINAVEKSNDENDTEKRGKDDEGEQQSELIENNNVHSVNECEIVVPTIDEAQAVSVVSSTHDISWDSGVKYLTESERQLGKARRIFQIKKPIWIDDKETLSCMLCCIKFTVFVRRHHCRCCGRVLCARCTTQKSSLSYVNNPKKEHRVCDPCFETLKRIEESEKNTRTGELADMNESGHSSDIIPVTKPALKLREKSENIISTSDNQGSLSNDAARGSSSIKRNVTFRDGLHPGYSSNEIQSSAADMGSSKPKKHDSRRYVSRRLLQLHVADECVCLLPGVVLASNVEETSANGNHQRATAENNCLYLRSNDGSIIECDNIQELINSLKNFEPAEVMIFRNLWCNIKLYKYENKSVMCIISKGMSFVGLDEIFLAYYCDMEFFELPIDYLWRIYEIYQDALSPRNDSSDEELGIRLAHNRIPVLNRTVRFSNSEKPVARDILLFRPSVQTFEDFLVPSSSFLVATFIYQCESIWATVIPQRLLFRLGLQASFYPTPIINDLDREPVYNSIFDTSVLKMFNDFRNWRFQMPFILGSTLTVRDNSESVLIIPTWALEEIIKLIKGNKNMVAWGLDFSPDADSYLVCKQDNTGCFNSQIFRNGIGNRKVTGASFIVIDGALKDGGEALSVNVLEDGMTIRFRSDIMESLIEALLVGQDFEHDSPAMKFSVKWDNDSYKQQPIGGLVSPIDNRSLIGCYQYGLKKSRILRSSHPIPNQLHWSLRLVSVYNVAKGRFVQRVQSKVFSVSEQVVAQIATTLAPFVTALIENDLRHIFFRIRVTTEDAEYKTQPWPGMQKEFAAWLDFLDYQVAPGLFTVCSYVTLGFHAELHMALISVRPNP
ncbi:unnamed protein product [Wuchereria bancrofti]|uniref:FYVE-type domain-containing protein n=2 Tax=Wuchereria bancrofti TaxID=6293 RepID=A0A3P7FDW4_WUCBA|nr:unnamed protein product [Wuchereria bancrofti]